MQRVTRRLFIFIAALGFVSIPVVVYAVGGFTDVPASHTFATDIVWMKDNGITLGCTATEYCPDSSVTRGQMAAFMHRLAINGVVDADTLDSHDSTHYRTIIDGRSCIVTDANCVDMAAGTVTELFEMSVTAPAAGYMQLSYSLGAWINTPTTESIASWVTIDGDPADNAGCEGVLLAMPTGLNAVDETARLANLDGSIINANISASPVVTITTGAHTVRLCGWASDNASTRSASLTTTWSEEGSS